MQIVFKHMTYYVTG